MESSITGQRNLLRLELECPICCGFYNFPVVTPCMHHFCRQCLDRCAENNLLDSSSCPYCRKEGSTALNKKDYKLHFIVEEAFKNPICVMSNCERHGNPHIVYCHNCSDVKCYSCFMETCRTEHNTESLADKFIELRKEIEKIDLESSRKSLWFYELAENMEKLAGLVKSGIKITKIWRQRNDDQEVVEANKKLQTQNMDPSMLDKKQAMMSSIQDMECVVFELLELDSFLVKAVSSLESIAGPIENSAVAADVLETSDSCSDSASLDSSFSHDGYDDWESLSASSFDDIYRPFLLFDEVVESVSVVGKTLYFSGEAGITRLNHNNVQQVMAGHITACAAINKNRMLVSFKDYVSVYRIGVDSIGKRIFTLPDLLPCYRVTLITGLGVSQSNPKLYYLADSKNYCIHVWDSKNCRWEKEIDVKALTCNQKPSFSLSVFANVIYLSLHLEKKIMAVTEHGQVRWENSEGLSGPHGLFVDNSGVYVCDRSCGVAVFTLDGDFLRTINEVKSSVDQPWSVANIEDKLFVLERYHRHDTRRSKIKLHVFTNEF